MSESSPDRPSITGRTIALVGLMGAGKSSVGRRLARQLGLPFVDADLEIERAAGRTVSEIFGQLGEPEFRAGERKVISRLLREPPHVLATGGGAFVDPATRALLREHAVTVWLKAELDTLVQRVARRDTRPLLKGRNPREVLAELMDRRHPLYAEAEIIIETNFESHAAAVAAIVAALRERLEVPA